MDKDIDKDIDTVPPIPDTVTVNNIINNDAMDAMEALDDMIPKAVVDQYIEDTVNKLFADKQKMERDEKVARRKVEEEVIEKYNGIMKDSDEPWVDLKGYTETEHGLRISIDWNDAFIDHLRAEGMNGTDEDQVVHTWLAMLMKDVTNDSDDSKGDFED